MLPLKMGLLSLGVYHISVNSCKDSYPTTTGKDFSISKIVSLVLPNTAGTVFCMLHVSAPRCIGCYPTTIGKAFLLWLSALSPAMRQKLPLKMSLPSLRVAFLKATYYLAIDSYHQEYS